MSEGSSKPPVTIRPIELADLPAALEFSSKVYRPNNVVFFEDYFRWVVHQTARMDHSAEHGAVMAERDGRIVGTFIVANHLFTANGEIRRGGWGHDWFTEAGHGPTGLKLLIPKLRSLWFYGGSGYGLQAQAVMRSLGMPSIWFEIERLIGIIDAAAATGLSVVRSEYTETFLRTIRVRPPSRAITALAVEAFDTDYDHVWDDVRPAFLLATHRTSRYMNWRYVDHPRFRYRRVVCHGSAGAVYYVWREERIAGRDQLVCRLCEVIGKPEAIVETFPSVFVLMCESGAVFVDFFCSNASINAALTAAGMASAVTRPELDLPRLFQPLEGHISKSLDFGLFFPTGDGALGPFDYHQAYITKGDANQDRPNIL